jgi:hypothetical protein
MRDGNDESDELNSVEVDSYTSPLSDGEDAVASHSESDNCDSVLRCIGCDCRVFECWVATSPEGARVSLDKALDELVRDTRRWKGFPRMLGNRQCVVLMLCFERDNYRCEPTRLFVNALFILCGINKRKLLLRRWGGQRDSEGGEGEEDREKPGGWARCVCTYILRPQRMQAGTDGWGTEGAKGV